MVVDGSPRVAVEAKAVDLPLTDKHGAQVVAYCSVLGDEWGVVTNGCEWRLYHSFTKGGLSEKLTASVDLVKWETDQQFDSVFEQLWLVSKEAFLTSDGPASWLNTKRIDSLLHQALTDPASPEVRYLRKRLQDQGVVVTVENVAAWLKARLDVPPPAPAPPGPGKVAPGGHGVTGGGGKPPEPEAPGAPLPGSRELIYLMTPVRSVAEATARETLESLLGHNVYVFGDRTAGRDKIRPGDRICFFWTGVGIVADAEIASAVERRAVEYARDTDSFPWAFAVRDVRYYFDSPVVIDAALRSQLDAFVKRGHDPNGPWAWLVQGTRYVTAHDFAVLTSR